MKGKRMSIQKLYEKIKNNQINVSFEEIDKLMVAGGFVRRTCKSSHNVYTHPDLHGIEDAITIPFKRPVKPPYVRMALKKFEEANPNFGKE